MPNHADDAEHDGPGRPLAAMVLFDGFTTLDLIGPHETLSRAFDTRLVSSDLEEVRSDSGVALRPTATYDDIPDVVEVLFVPGGAGTATAIADEALLGFLRTRGARASWITSVCSGSLILGQAGLLDGYRATSHWTALELLPLWGAVASDERVVVDRNRLTGGGVTAGIDFGLTLLATVFGDDVAKATQLQMEYDPAPPFTSGSPRTADPELVKRVRSHVTELNKEITAHVQAHGIATPGGHQDVLLHGLSQVRTVRATPPR